MRESKREQDEEMLIVHKPPTQAEPDKLGRAHADASSALGQQELELMKRRAAAAQDPRLRREILSRIGQRFGNDKAAQVLQEVREQSSGDELGGKPGAGSRSKGKA